MLFKCCSHSFDLCAVSELLDGVTVLCVVLQQDGHLEGGGLQCVPGNKQQIQYEAGSNYYKLLY